MSFIPEGFGEWVITFTQNGTTRPAQMTFGVAPEGIPDWPGSAQNLFFENAQTGGILAAAAYDVSMTLSSSRVTFQSNTGPVIFEVFPNVPGARTGEALPPNTAVLVRRSTDRGGRQGRGRLYLPSGYANETDTSEGGNLTPARQADLQNRVTTINTRFFAAGNLKPVLLHNQVGLTPDDIESWTVQQRLATMRRRLRK